MWTYPGALVARPRRLPRGSKTIPTVKADGDAEDALLDPHQPRRPSCSIRSLAQDFETIAAENTGVESGRGVELDPLYVDVIVRRYEAASGEAAAPARDRRNVC